MKYGPIHTNIDGSSVKIHGRERKRITRPASAKPSLDSLSYVFTIDSGYDCKTVGPTGDYLG
jgi:hypothetical protein